MTTAVIPTTVIHLSARKALDFAELLEAQKLADVLLEHHILDIAALKTPREQGFYLDQSLIALIVPDMLFWLKEHQCHQLPGCRVAGYEKKGVMEEVLKNYQGNCWEQQRYAVIAASALEIAIVLEFHECACLLQEELPIGPVVG